ncbi:hypothetical protein HOL34_00455 [bacterium]|nr:hypothetical protein [bacterium]MBT3903948.1 hypothetical protein [bacterium]MBT4577958.1 hypothetical protein [bacterium]MBT5345430.1 hypothetical protein [bacterium]MBT6131439.1 hypothetical protein [bacterium]
MKRLLLVLGFVVVVFFVWKHMQKNSDNGLVVILNGPSSVGKSSIIKLFQEKNEKLWLGIGIDSFFVGVLSSKFYLEDKPEHHAVMRGIASVNSDGNKVFDLCIGEVGQKVIKGMNRAIGAYARAGNNVIVDYINYDSSWIEDLKAALSGVKVVFIGVKATLETIEAREKIRATSPQGHARSHYDSVHQGIVYDLVLDTENKTASQAAQELMEFIRSKA